MRVSCSCTHSCVSVLCSMMLGPFESPLPILPLVPVEEILHEWEVVTACVSRNAVVCSQGGAQPPRSAFFAAKKASLISSRRSLRSFRNSERAVSTSCRCMRTVVTFQDKEVVPLLLTSHFAFALSVPCSWRRSRSHASAVANVVLRHKEVLEATTSKTPSAVQGDDTSEWGGAEGEGREK